MSDFKKTIGLVATRISFTQFSIIYEVKLESPMIDECKLKYGTPVVCSPIDIVDKDLLLKPTMISDKNMVVVYTPSNMIPHYYQALLEETLSNFEEHKIDIRNIYNIGDTVGYIQL